MIGEVRSGDFLMYGGHLIKVISPNHGRIANAEFRDGVVRQVDLAKTRPATQREKERWSS